MKKEQPAWVVIYMARSQAAADSAARLLENEGFLVRSRRVSLAASSGEACIELLALGAEAVEARGILTESGYM